MHIWPGGLKGNVQGTFLWKRDGQWSAGGNKAPLSFHKREMCDEENSFPIFASLNLQPN